MIVEIIDGGRHRVWSGYGSLSRSIIRGLAAQGHQIVTSPSSHEWDLEAPERRELEEIFASTTARPDVSLCVGTPRVAPKRRVPTAIYTQNALGDLPVDWQAILKGFNLIMVPGEFDRHVFSRYYENVVVVPQVVEEQFFSPVPRYRQEGGAEFTVTFVGSFGFRKGTDILLEAVREAFSSEPARLRLFLAASPNFDLTGLIRELRRMPKSLEVEAFTKKFSPRWMARHYNRSDLVVTFSRGEGWCMPLHESLLCGVPVVAPNSTAMGEWLPSPGVILASAVKTRLDSGAPVPGRDAFAERYGAQNSVWHVPSESAVEALRQAYADWANLRAAALSNVEELRQRNQPHHIGAAISSALDGLMAAVPVLRTD